MSGGLLLPRTNDARRAAYAAGKKIQCLVDKLLTNLSETAIASCENAQARERSCKVFTRGPQKPSNTLFLAKKNIVLGQKTLVFPWVFGAAGIGCVERA